VLAWVYRRSGALTSAMIAHGTFNAVQVLLIVFAHQT
jgi:membrane protease YdiL (CAAX protease family)